MEEDDNNDNRETENRHAQRASSYRTDGLAYKLLLMTGSNQDLLDACRSDFNPSGVDDESNSEDVDLYMDSFIDFQLDKPASCKRQASMR
jgi:hypothetical protein